MTTIKRLFASIAATFALVGLMAAPAVYAQMAPAAEGKAELTFAVVDANKDGGIDKKEAELFPALAKIFDQADANKDGKLDEGEFAAAVKMMKGK